MGNSERNGRPERRGGVSPILTVLAIVVIVILIGAVIFLAMLLIRNLTASNSRERSNRAIVVTEDNVEDILSEMEEMDVPLSIPYEVAMTTTWTFDSGTSPSEDMYVANPENNETDVYFDVQLRDTGEVIYSSPVLPVGTYIEHITLDKDLDPGSYRCVCVYYLVDEDQNVLARLNMAMQVVVST